MSINTLVSSSVSRRTVIKFALGATAAVAVGGVTLTPDAGARSGGAYRTTTTLNFRAKPDASSRVLAVLPKGTQVGYLGERKNGYLAVSYNGQSGWAYESYLEFVADSTPNPAIIGAAIVTSSANFRSGPSSGHQVLHVLARGTRVDITATVQNGYRQVVVGHQVGWVYESLLAPEGGEGPGVFFTTSAVNLRSKPSTGSSVVTVVPAGAKVLDYDFVMSNGFRGVDYNGKVGWIYDSYLTR